MRPAPMGTLSLAILWLLLQLALAGNQYCYPKGNTNRFHLSKRLEFIEDRIIPQTDGDPVPEEGLSCKWKISNDYLDDPIIVLTGFDTKEHLSRERWTRSIGSTNRPQLMRYELNSKASNSSCSSTSTRDPQPVELKMLRVLELSRGSNLGVSFRLTQKSLVNTPGLRIRLMEPGFCGREITYFDSNCYMTSSNPRSLNEELAAMKEDSRLMRLASFNSWKALQNFVRESQRTRFGSGLSTRSKEPQNLTHNLRIGMFFEHRTEKVFYLNSAGDKFEMAEFEDADRLNLTVQASNSPVSCGSLRAAQQPGGGEAVGLVDFANCSQPLPALISFADAARNRCENSSDTVLTWLREGSRSQEQKKAKPDSSTSRNSEIPIIPFAVASPLLLTAACATIFICLSRNRNCCCICRLRMTSDNSSLYSKRDNLEAEACKPVLLLGVEHHPSDLISTDLDCYDTQQNKPFAI